MKTLKLHIFPGLAALALAAAPPTALSGQTIVLPAPGEASQIKIAYDGIGTPHIEAGSERAGYAGLCYALARDRLFQMELFRRSAQGRLSELFGAGPDGSVLGQDQFFRGFGLTGLAREHFNTASAHTRGVLRACAAGVELYRQEIADGRSPLPREFADLGGFIPEPWAAEDGLLVGVYLQTALDMPTWQTKLTAGIVSQFAGADIAAALVPPAGGGSMFDARGNLNPPGGAAGGGAPTSPPRPPAGRLGTSPQDAARALRLPRSPLGPNYHGWRASNNFAVGGQLTETGKPLLANDPHLMLAMPSMFYQAELKVAGLFDVAGFLIPGIPAFIIGHNAQIGWAVTYGMLDAADLYLETVRGAEVQYRGAFVPLRTRTEWFYPAGGEPVSMAFSDTPHGPLLNSAAPALDAIGPLALKSTVAQPEWSLNGWFDLPAANSWEAFNAALAQESIGLNYLYADGKGRHGHIGYRQTGLAPQRPRANAAGPVAGGDGGGEWTRYARYDELASVFDPPAHVLATANHRIVPDDYAPAGAPVYLSNGWDEPWRAQRAMDLLLSAPQPLTAAAVARVQLDQTSPTALALAQRLAAILARAGLPAGDADAAWSLAKLQSFDGNLAAGSPAAAVYEAVSAVLLRDMAAGVLGPDLYPGYAQSVFYTAELHALIDQLEHPKAPFFGAASPADAAAARDAAVQNALAEADAMLRRALGADHAAWTWGGLHTLTYNHPFAALDPAFALPTYPVGGDPSTLNTGGWNTRIGLLALPPGQLDEAGGARAAFAQDGLASARTVMDTADFDRSLWVNSTGASGDPLSPHWADQAAAWRAGRYFRVPYGN